MPAQKKDGLVQKALQYKKTIVTILTVIGLVSGAGGGFTINDYFAKESRVNHLECQATVILADLSNSVTRLEQTQDMEAMRRDIIALTKILTKTVEEQVALDELIQGRAILAQQIANLKVKSKELPGLDECK